MKIKVRVSRKQAGDAADKEMLEHLKTAEGRERLGFSLARKLSSGQLTAEESSTHSEDMPTTPTRRPRRMLHRSISMRSAPRTPPKTPTGRRSLGHKSASMRLLTPLLSGKSKVERTNKPKRSSSHRTLDTTETCTLDDLKNTSCPAAPITVKSAMDKKVLKQSRRLSLENRGITLTPNRSKRRLSCGQNAPAIGSLSDVFAAYDDIMSDFGNNSRSSGWD